MVRLLLRPYHVKPQRAAPDERDRVIQGLTTQDHLIVTYPVARVRAMGRSHATRAGTSSLSVSTPGAAGRVRSIRVNPPR